MTQDDLASLVRATRARLGLSLADVERQAKNAGRKVSKTYIKQVEDGVSDPTASKLEAIAAGLGVPVTDLLSFRHGLSTASPPDAASAGVRRLRVIGPASCGSDVFSEPGPDDEAWPYPGDMRGDVVVRVDGSSMGGAGIEHGDRAVIAQVDPATIQDGCEVCVDHEGGYAIKRLRRPRGAEAYLEEHWAGQQPRRLGWERPAIIGEVVAVIKVRGRR